MPTDALPSAGAFCVVMHDVAPATWPQCTRLLDALRQVAPFPATLLVVPRYHRGTPSRDDRSFCAALSARLQAGDELVLHGLTHRDDAPLGNTWQFVKRRFYTASEGEFASLSEATALARIEAGLQWFQEERWPLHGFVAPAWLMSEGTWAALKRTNLSYTTTLGGVHLLREGRRIASQSLVYSSRSAWRRVASRWFVAALATRLSHVPLVRLGLHPIDAEYPRVIGHWQRLLEQFAKTRQPVTKHAFLSQLQGTPQCDVVANSGHWSNAAM